MDNETTTGGSARLPWRELSLWLVAGCGALAFYVLSYAHVNPEAALELNLTRHDALTRAREILEGQRVDLSGYRAGVGLYTDTETKSFLEKELGLREANRAMASDAAPWSWYVRWVVPEQEEEYRVELAPDDGRLRVYHHVVEEAAPGASLSEEEARGIAETFLAALDHVDLAEYDRKSVSQTERPARMDHFFTWEGRDIDYQGAKLRIVVGIAGDEVQFYWETVKIPEDWTRGETRKRGQRRLLMYAAQSLLWLLYGACLILFVLRLRRHVLRFRFAAVLATMAVALVLCSDLNKLSYFWLTYETTETIGAALGVHLLGVLILFSSVLGNVTFLLPPAESLGRDVFPRHVELSRLFNRRAWASRPVFVAAWCGCCLALLHAGYCSAFYLGAQWLGAWCPLETPYTNSVATPIPWIEPLVTGFTPALYEETIFRLLAISLLLRYTKRRWVAVLLPAVVWAFLHSNYPQEPVYIRGIELTVVGIVYGIVYLRYGILATMVAHFGFNALVSSTFLFASGNAYFILCGAIVVGLAMAPMLPGLWRLIHRRALLSDAEALALPIKERRLRFPPPLKDDPSQYRPFMPLPTGRSWILMSLAAAGVVASLFVSDTEQFGDYVRIRVSRTQAKEIADAYLAERGVDTGRFRSVTRFRQALDGDSADYIWKHLEVERDARLDTLNGIFRRHFPSAAAWSVWYFIPLEKESYTVRVAPDGKVLTHYHGLHEDAPGGQLSPEEARALAEAYVRETVGDAFDRYRPADANEHKRPARTDHRFAWEDTSETIGEAEFRISARVKGDEACSLGYYLDIPDEWQRERDKRDFGDIAAATAAAALGLALASAIMYLAYHLLVRRAVRFRVPLLLALIPAGLAVVGWLNELATFWWPYSTATSPATYLPRAIATGLLAGPAATFVLACLALAFADAAYRYAFPDRLPLAYWLGMERWLHRDPAARAPRPPLALAWGEAIIVACCALFAINLIDVLVPWQHIDRAALSSLGTPSAEIVGNSDAFLPAIEGTVFVSVSTCFVFAGGLLLASIARRYLSRLRRLVRPGLLVALLAGLALVYAPGGESQPLGSVLVNVAVLGGTLSVLARYFLRDNLPGYAMLFFLSGLVEFGGSELEAANLFAQLNGAALLALFCAIALIGAALYARGMKDCRAHESPVGPPLQGETRTFP